MSKKKKPQKRDYDVHHLCYPRRQWSSGYAKAIRNYWYFMVFIPRKTLHADIHKKLKCIPCPSDKLANEVYDQIRTMEKHGVLLLNDPIEKRLELLISLFGYKERRTTEALISELDIIRKYNQKPS